MLEIKRSFTPCLLEKIRTHCFYHLYYCYFISKNSKVMGEIEFLTLATLPHDAIRIIIQVNHGEPMENLQSVSFFQF